VTTKRGPQGQALLTSLSELTILPHDLIQDINELGGKALSNKIEMMTEGLDILEAIRNNSIVTSGYYFSISQ